MALIPGNEGQDKQEWPQTVSGQAQVGGKVGQALAQDAQGNGEDSIPAGIEKLCGTWLSDGLDRAGYSKVLS